MVRYSIDNKYSDLDTISLNVGVNLSRGNKDCLSGLESVHIQQQRSEAAGVAWSHETVRIHRQNFKLLTWEAVVYSQKLITQKTRRQITPCFDL